MCSCSSWRWRWAIRAKMPCEHVIVIRNRNITKLHRRELEQPCNSITPMEVLSGRSWSSAFAVCDMDERDMGLNLAAVSLAWRRMSEVTSYKQG